MILEEALALVDGPRKESYGDPRDIYAVAEALTWTVTKLRDEDFPPESRAILFMVCLKLCRFARRAARDDLVDAAGYIELLGRVSLMDG